MSKGPAVATVEAEVVPATDKEERAARELDQAIDQNIRELGTQMAETYLTIGKQLKQMKDSDGWQFLEAKYDSWTEYLNSKTTYGKTYMSYLLKLGSADQDKLSGLIQKGLTGTHLIEYAKATTDPKKIPQLIEKTIAKVASRPTREATKVIRDYVEKNRSQYRPRTGKGGGRPKDTIEQKVWSFFNGLEEHQRIEAVRFLETFKDENNLAQFLKNKPRAFN